MKKTWLKAQTGSAYEEVAPHTFAPQVYMDDSMGKTVAQRLEEVAQGRGSNPNLLINGDFQVWQRGESFKPVSGGNVYTADRWKTYQTSANAINCANSADGQKFSNKDSSAVLLQSLEKPLRNVKTLSLSAMIDGVTVEGQLSVPGDKILFVGNAWAYAYAVAANNVYCALGSNDRNEHTFGWVKLEYGAVTTPFIPRLYGEELALCQRFYQRHDNVIVGSHNGTGYYDGTHRLWVPMRVKPYLTVTSPGNKKGVVGLLQNGAWVDGAYSLLDIDEQQFRIGMTHTASHYHFSVTCDAEMY